MSPATILEPEDIWIDSLLHAEPETAGVEHASPTYGEKDENDEKDEITDLGIFCERAAANSFTLRDIEEAYIQWVLTRTGGNKSFAADILGLNRTTLHRRLSRMTKTTTPQRRLALVN
jgi:DNA-binding NtrC family response regulator